LVIPLFNQPFTQPQENILERRTTPLECLSLNLPTKLAVVTIEVFSVHIAGFSYKERLLSERSKVDLTLLAIYSKIICYIIR